ncbi:MAG: hypothetical protein PVI03_05885, partial [Candidatus Thorarchaeota archaeon]
ADQIGLGGAWVDGHSDPDDYGINNKGNQSWGLHLNYDKDVGWKKMLGENSAIGIDPSLQLFYLHWSKTINGEKTTCKPIEWEPQYDYPEVTTNCIGREECKTEKTYKTQNVDSLVAGVGPKAYFALGRFQIYGLAAMGYALQDGAQDDAAGILQAGVSAQITKNFGLSLDHSEVFVNPFGEYDRFDVTALNAVLFF